MAGFKLFNRVTRTRPEDNITYAGKNLAAKAECYEKLKTQIHQRLIEELASGKDCFSPGGQMDYQWLDSLIACSSGNWGDSEYVTLSPLEKDKLIGELTHEVWGFGPVQPLLEDDGITEIMVNGPQQVYIERNGKLILTDIKFRDDGHVMNVIERIVAPLGRRVDRSSPLVDARLPDGSRVNVIIPPLALQGPCLSIRKFSKYALSIADLVGMSTLSEPMVSFLRACVEGKLNMIVSGGTGTGKTTTLNILSSFIPPGERIITIEDAAELQLKQEHVISLETRPANIEGAGTITIRDLVCNALRMRPDRIIVGEVRAAETLDMLQAMNTGHDGSMTTGHANSPRDVLRRLETMAMMAGVELPVKAIREQIGAAIDIIIQQARFPDGTRRITHISEVLGMDNDVVVLQDIFLFGQVGKDASGLSIGTFRPTGVLPRVLEKLKASGIFLDKALFVSEDKG
jgi:pilus assembly protein CpaF